MKHPKDGQVIRVTENPEDSPEVVEEKIRQLAYHLYCECGCEHGHDLKHWIEAERRILEPSSREHAPRR